MANERTSIFAQRLTALAAIEADEVKATAISFAIAFLIMVTYYILRPVRDAMASDWTDAELSFLWSTTFFISLIVVAIYGAAASRVAQQKLAPAVYGLFSASFLLFYLTAQTIEQPNLLDKAFYVWVSLFSLFPISLFWSLMTSLYNKTQSKRLFGIITTGASVGAIIGPSIPLLFSGISSYNLMLVATIVLLTTIPTTYYLYKTLSIQASAISPARLEQSLGGTALSGFRLFLHNPFLLAIGFFLFLYTGIGAFVYFELKNLMADYSREQRTEIWALIDLTTNTLTILTGLFITSRLAQNLGLGITLALIPLLIVGGLFTVAIVPALTLVVGLQVLRRAGNYAITRPAREMLFSYVDQETRFKAKQVIDVVIYRGGDVFWAWAFTGLTQLVGFSIAGVAAVGAVIASLWALVGLYLGRRPELNNHEANK